MRTLLALAFIVGAGMAQQAQTQAAPPIHGPRSIDQELDHLTKNLELTPKQRQQIRPLLQEHHDKIQALMDKNPTVSRQDLAPQIHAISNETHHQIKALLTDHQKELAKAMQERMHRGQEGRK
jgi:Spy/CpxP family protein refolding chaperone